MLLVASFIISVRLSITTCSGDLSVVKVGLAVVDVVEMITGGVVDEVTLMVVLCSSATERKLRLSSGSEKKSLAWVMGGGDVTLCRSGLRLLCGLLPGPILAFKFKPPGGGRGRLMNFLTLGVVDLSSLSFVVVSCFSSSLSTDESLTSGDFPSLSFSLLVGSLLLSSLTVLDSGGVTLSNVSSSLGSFAVEGLQEVTSSNVSAFPS